MTASVGTGQFWLCPKCRKHVPARVAQCACGFSRAGLVGVELESPTPRREDAPNRRSLFTWLLLPACALLLYVSIAGWNRTTPSETPGSRGFRVAPQQPAQPQLILVPVPTGASPNPPLSQKEITPLVSLLGQPQDPSAIFQRVAPGVVIVSAARQDGFTQGSGVVLAAGTIVTNRHVVQGASQVRISQGNQSWQPTTVRLDSRHDLAELRVAGLPASPVAVRSSRDLQIGERVYAIGAPKGLELTLSEGLVSSLRSYQGGTAIQTTAPLSHGSSGGGLFDARGRLIGITTFGITDAETLNFALPVEWASAIDGVALGITPGWVGNTSLGWGGEPAEEPTEVDRMREAGTKAFEEAVAALARKATAMDVTWRRYADACMGRYTVAYSFGRDWFGL